MTTSAFEAFGSSRTASGSWIERGPAPKSSKAQAKAEALKKVREERGQLQAQYHQMKAQWAKEVMQTHDPNRRVLRLFSFVRSLEASELGKLLAPLRKATWLLSSHADLRFLVLQEIDQIIMAKKRKLKLDPLDDPIPDLTSPSGPQGMTVFFAVKAILGVR